MGPFEPVEAKQIYFCAFCNGPGVVELEHGTRLCTPCHNWHVRGGFNQIKYQFRRGVRPQRNRPTKIFKPVKNPNKKRLATYQEQERICYYCRLSIPFEDWTIDHLHPTSRGGTRNKVNEVGACSDCNGLKGNMTEAEFRASPQFPKPARPAPPQTPVATPHATPPPREHPTNS